MNIGKDEIIGFESAHFLTDYKGKCRKLHGHSYHGKISITGIKIINGLLEGIDFGDIKNVVHNTCKHLDHKILVPDESIDVNIETDPTGFKVTWRDCHGKTRSCEGPVGDFAFLPLKYTTVESIAKYLKSVLKREIEFKIKRKIKVKLKLYETKTSFVEV